MKKGRYLNKIESFEKEKAFIEDHNIDDNITERAVLYSLQVCVEVSMDLVAMKTKDSGLLVEDDYSNIERLVDEDIINEEEGDTLKQFNGIRNAVVHKYDKLDMKIIKQAVGKIDELSEVIYKVCE